MVSAICGFFYCAFFFSSIISTLRRPSQYGFPDLRSAMCNHRMFSCYYMKSLGLVTYHVAFNVHVKLMRCHSIIISKYYISLNAVHCHSELRTIRIFSSSLLNNNNNNNNNELYSMICFKFVE